MGKYLPPFQVVEEIKQAAGEISDQQIDRLYRIISRHRRVFVSGQGRSGLVARMFAMRLMHLGLETYVAGETITPAITAGDLLITCSGSGETRKVIVDCQQAREAGAGVLLFTASPESTLEEMADASLILKTPSKDKQSFSRQYGGSLFEQTLLVVLDSLISYFIAQNKQDFSSLHQKHTNME